MSIPNTAEWIAAAAAWVIAITLIVSFFKQCNAECPSCKAEGKNEYKGGQVISAEIADLLGIAHKLNADADEFHRNGHDGVASIFTLRANQLESGLRALTRRTQSTSAASNNSPAPGLIPSDNRSRATFSGSSRGDHSR